jgi:hypothetical protein
MIFGNFFVIGFPETDQSPAGSSPCIYGYANPVTEHCNRASRDDACFIIIKARIDFFDKVTIKNMNAQSERKAVFFLVDGILVIIKFKIHLHAPPLTPPLNGRRAFRLLRRNPRCFEHVRLRRFNCHSCIVRSLGAAAFVEAVPDVVPMAFGRTL